MKGKSELDGPAVVFRPIIGFRHMTVFIIFALLSVAMLSFVVFTQPVAAYASLAVTGQVVPSIIEPGDSGNLILTISNGGTSYARHVKLTIKSHSFITFSQKSYDLQTIAPGNSAQVSVPITISSTIPEGTTSVFLTVSYSEGESTATNTMGASTSISISRRSLVQIESVSWDKEIIAPGDIVNAVIEIKNVGLGNLKDTIVVFGNATLPFVPAADDLEVYVGNIFAGDTKMAEFSIIVNKEAKTVAYQVPIGIKYYDDASTLHTDTKYIGLKISGQPDFVVTLEDDSKMYTGAEGELTFSLANRGTATANFLTLSFDSNLDITPSEYYVGNLDPDDYETITLSIDLSAVAPNKHSLDITMGYKDPYNQEMVESASVGFTVRSTPPFRISLTTQIIIIVVVIVILYWKRKFFFGFLRRKK